MFSFFSFVIDLAMKAHLNILKALRNGANGKITSNTDQKLLSEYLIKILFKM